MNATRATLASVVMLVLVGVACGDVVYTRDGMVYHGRVRKVDGKLIVETDEGPVELPAEDVLHHSEAQAQTQPTTEQAAEPVRQVPMGKWQFPLQRVRQPEVFVFSMMRSLAARPSGAAAQQMQQQIRRWRIASKDRMRNTGMNHWVPPKEFIRRRQVFERHLSEAEQLYKDIRLALAKNKKEYEVAPLLRRAQTKLYEAANTWADPLLRNFLVAVAWMESENFGGAEERFARCRTEAPHVAAFHQGHGMVLLQLNQPLRALEAFTQALRLDPRAQNILQLAQYAARQIPGSRTEDPIYIEAGRLLRDYADAARSRSRTGRAAGTARTEWLMPPKAWRVGPGTLPRPPYDRLVLTQALAVPAGPSALLVDAGAVEGAAGVYVRIHKGAVVPARIKRRSYGSRRSGASAQIAVLEVDGCRFAPVALADVGSLQKGQQVTIHGLGRYQEMGSATRTISSEIRAVDDSTGISLARQLLAGESAGPVLDADGALVGFLAAKADVTADDGGPNRLIAHTELADLLKQAQKASRPSAIRRAQPAAESEKVDGEIFTVYAVTTETLD